MENMADACMEESPLGKLYLEESPPRGSRTTDSYKKLKLIGEGAYGQVYKAKDILTGEIVAMKKVRIMDKENEGFPVTALREIRILKALQHENVIKLKEVITSPGRKKDGKGSSDSNKYKGGVYMVFEYMEHDLTGLTNRPGVRFSVPQIKCYMKQLLIGLHYCHLNEVVHRDIKGSNLLLNNEGTLKLADFGLARPIPMEDTRMTNRVITLWYKPPEILLGATKYGPAVDIWSVGCLFAEFYTGRPILRGKDEQDQLREIFVLCGSPDENNWPGVSKIPWYIHFKQPLLRRLRKNFHYLEPYALDLLDRMLTLDPSQRISAKDALDTDYFWTEPLPCDPQCLPKYESSHALESQQIRQKAAAKRQKQRQQQHSPPGASRSSQSPVSDVTMFDPTE